MRLVTVLACIAAVLSCAWAEDDENYPPWIIDSITQMQKSISPHQVKRSVNDPACSEVRIECYGECLNKVVNALAKCFKGPSWNFLHCVEGIFLKTASYCFPCICQLIKEYWPWWYQLLQKLGLGCPEDKPKQISHQCDRECTHPNSSPFKCVFNFKLEFLKTDKEGRRADGRLRSVLAYNGQIPGPPIVICEGDELVVNFKNDINESMMNVDGLSSVTTLHFHGIGERNRPWSDGVPFVTQCPIIPGGNFTYGFKATDAAGAPPGTYWYHSHVGSQRTNGAYGALIIKEKVKDKKIDVDDAANTLVLQEWYESSIKPMPRSILINGKGRVNGEGKYKVMDGEDELEVLLNYLKGKGGHFQLDENEDHNADHFTTNYEEFNVTTNQKYRFRVIGAISQNFPLRLSIDGHKFTAIAVDSLNIVPVPELTDLWLAAGERYDIVVHTKLKYTKKAYKIKVFGYAHPNEQKHPLCTIAWLKYPGQKIDPSYVTPSNCKGFDLKSDRRTLNPVPNNFKAWYHRIKAADLNKTSITGDIFIADLRATKQQPTINLFNGSTHSALLNTHYIEFTGNITFNGLRMIYPDVPFLLQDPAKETHRCGSECDFNVDFTKLTFEDLATYSTYTKKTPCAPNPKPGECQHVIKEPWVPGYWAEFVLINNDQEAAAHPIHQHGGWYWVVGMNKYDYDANVTVNRDYIMGQDKNCTRGKYCLPRNFDYPPAKDTIQVPQNGYVIVRTKLDNAGTWIFHCHINYHVEIGMAMVLQIGEFGKPEWEAQDWCTGPLQKDEVCPTKPPSPDGGPEDIYWHLGMENDHYYRCVKPGVNVTFVWIYGHSVNWLKPKNWKDCAWDKTTRQMNGKPIDTKEGYGPHVFSKMIPGRYHMACGVGHGWHCKNGMKALIEVSNHCHHP